jgi:radical SAM superfamily enzyme YgiQ (UPF0313 family)
MKIERALLISPPSGLYRRDDRCQCKVEDQTVAVIFPPIEMGYMAAILEHLDIQCQIRDYPAEKGDWEKYKNDFLSFQPDLLILNTTTPTLKNDMIAAEIAREINPDIYIIARGEYFSAHQKESLEEYPLLNLALHGEPEMTLDEVAKTLKADSSLDGVQGMAYRKGTEVVVNPPRPLLEELDNLPYPSRHLMNHSLYRSPENNRPITVIHTQRGCPARCIFCSVVITSGQKVRKRSPENVLGEIKECVEVHGIRDFLFHADTFTWDKEWVIKLCQLIIDSGLKIHWGCNSRVDSIDPERLSWLKKAGCWVIAFGIESGDEEMLKKMRKGTTLEEARTALKMVREAGIKTHAFMVMGLPWETRETIKKSLAFLKELDPDFFDFNLAYPLPGTELMKLAEKDNLLVYTNPSDGSYAQALLKSYQLSPQELTLMRKKALWQMYLRPKYVVRTLFTSGSPKNTWHYMKAAVKRALNLIKS